MISNSGTDGLSAVSTSSTRGFAACSDSTVRMMRLVMLPETVDSLIGKGLRAALGVFSG